MKINQDFAKQFAREWIQSWNNRDLESILKHYDERVVFSSPFILKAKINDAGTLTGKKELRIYFEKALANNPDLHFDLKKVMVGVKSISLFYLRKKTMLACETMILNQEGKVIEGMSHYPMEDLFNLLKS